MIGILLKIFGLAAALLLTAFALASAWRSKRRLDARLQQFREEQEAQRRAPGAINPYAALSELYHEADSDSAPRSRKRPR